MISEINTGQKLPIAERQATAAQDSVAAIRRQMRQDQRAWIRMKQVEKLVFAENQPITVNLRVVNIGKTAARKMETEVVMEKLAINSSPSISFKKGVP